jgi:hypothetical protein
MTDEEPSGRKRDHYLPLWVTEQGFEAIEERRGTWSRSEYVRQALSLAFREKLRGPTVPSGPPM